MFQGAAKEQQRRKAVPLMWWLKFDVTRGDTPTDVEIACRWISNSWVNLTAWSKKIDAAYRKQADSAAAALKDEATARQELHRISAHRQMSALIAGDDVEPRDFHDLLAWVQNKNLAATLTVELERFTKDTSDGTVITQADFARSAPIGYRIAGGSGYVFDFRLGPVEWEDLDEP